MGIISATDIRYCTNDAWFQVKEVLMGLTPDIGTLQRMPRLMGSESLVRELVYTGKKVDATEALRTGLVNRVYDDKERCDRLRFQRFNNILYELRDIFSFRTV